MTTAPLYHAFLPANLGETAPHLTLIHGWGADSAGWQDWAQTQLCPTLNVHLIDLPGFGHSAELSSSSDWLVALAQTLPEHTHLLGWSLGGLLAQQLALAHPDKVQSLICMASTPRFIQQEGWPNAVSPQMMADFIKALGIEYMGVLKQFWNLQLQGSDNARSLMKQLASQTRGRKIPKLSGLTQGLKLLRDLDNRQALHQLQQPSLWLFGENDPLIPLEIQTQLPSLQTHAQIQVIKGSSHMPFFSHPLETAQAILNFINAQKP